MSSGLSALSISLYTELVFCIIMYLRMVCAITLSTRLVLNVLGKCDVQGQAMQSFAHHHDGVVKIKYRNELLSLHATFSTYNQYRDAVTAAL